MDGELVIEPVTEVALDELVELYDAVGRSAYTRTPALLRAAIAGSSYVVAARRAQRLVGLARAVSDDATICYLRGRRDRRFRCKPEVSLRFVPETAIIHSGL